MPEENKSLEVGVKKYTKYIPRVLIGVGAALNLYVGYVVANWTFVDIGAGLFFIFVCVPAMILGTTLILAGLRLNKWVVAFSFILLSLLSFFSIFLFYIDEDLLFLSANFIASITSLGLFWVLIRWVLRLQRGKKKLIFLSLWIILLLYSLILRISPFSFIQGPWIEDLAIKTKNEFICGTASFFPEGNKNYCYSKIAIMKKDLTICDKSSNVVSKSGCYSSFGVYFNDETVCEKISQMEFYESWSLTYCYKEVAKAKRDPSLCSYVNEDYRDSACYEEIAIITGDVTICEMIKKEGVKNDCYREVNK